MMPERTYAQGKRMFKERMVEIRANPADASPAEIAWLVDHIAEQQREIDGLLGLLIVPNEGAGFIVRLPAYVMQVRWFATEAEARDAVRTAWEGK